MQIHSALMFQRPGDGDKCTEHPFLLLAASEQQLAAKLADHLKEWGDGDPDVPSWPIEATTVQPFIDYCNEYSCYWEIKYEVQEVVA